MKEQRSEPRQITNKGGRIIFARQPGIDCTIRNLSSAGACLEIERDILEETFGLVIKPEYLHRHCQVVWRVLNTVGVKFLQSSG